MRLRIHNPSSGFSFAKYLICVFIVCFPLNRVQAEHAISRPQDTYDSQRAAEKSRVAERNADITELRQSLEMERNGLHVSALSTERGAANIAVLHSTVRVTQDFWQDIMILGELQNKGDFSASFVKVRCTFKDTSGAVLGSDFTYVNGSARKLESGIVIDTVLTPGEVGAFKLYTNIPAKAVDSISHTIDFETYTVYPLLGDVQVYGEVKEEADYFGDLELVGQLQNTGDTTAYFIRFVPTIKNAYGRVLDTTFTYVEGESIALDSGITTDTALFPDSIGTFKEYSYVPFSQAHSISYKITWEEDGTAWQPDPCSDLGGDTDKDSVCDDLDNCPSFPNRLQKDADGDGVGTPCDNCPNTPNSGQEDMDADGVGDICEGCPNDPDKSAPGDCGCGFPDTDFDRDGTADCNDGCSFDPDKTEPGVCGCGIPDEDVDGNGIADCNDTSVDDPGDEGDCTGCCAYHGGVCCIGGVTMCCDETPLSSTCEAKGCNLCVPPVNDDNGNKYEETVTVRLYGVDCPELDQPYGAAAGDFLANRILGTYVNVTPIDIDLYGRTVAIVRVGDKCLNEDLLAEGFAWLYTDYCERSECAEWRNLENEARFANRGLWEALDPIPPWNWRQIPQADSDFGAAVIMNASLTASGDPDDWGGSVVAVIDGDTIDVSRISSDDGSDPSDSSNIISDSSGGGGG